jgi:hypothetical protein
LAATLKSRELLEKEIIFDLVENFSFFGIPNIHSLIRVNRDSPKVTSILILIKLIRNIKINCFLSTLLLISENPSLIAFNLLVSIYINYSHKAEVPKAL